MTARMTVWQGKCPKCGALIYWNGDKNYGPFVCTACKKKQ